MPFQDPVDDTDELSRRRIDPMSTEDEAAQKSVGQGSSGAYLEGGDALSPSCRNKINSIRCTDGKRCYS